MTIQLPVPYVVLPDGSLDSLGVQQDLDALGVSLGQVTQYASWRDVGGSGQPAFQNSWVNHGSTSAVAAFYRDSSGVVRIKGLVKNGTGATTIFTLPVGYRPTEDRYFAATSFDGSNYVAGNTMINAAGDVKHNNGGTSFHSVECSFRAG